MNNIRHLIKAFFYSLAGLRFALSETAFRQELVLFAILAPLGMWLGQTPAEKALLVGCLMLVLVAELVNSAIEAAIDRLSSDRHPLSGRAKDMGSAAVFLAIINVIVVWTVIVVAPMLPLNV
ncbi:MAG: diacylglycerol kinase [Gammaproteobacteria bacterium]